MNAQLVVWSHAGTGASPLLERWRQDAFPPGLLGQNAKPSRGLWPESLGFEPQAIENEGDPPKPPARLKLLYASGEAFTENLLLALRERARKDGFDLQLLPLEQAILVDRLRRGDFELACSVVVFEPHPWAVLEYMEPKGPMNVTGWQRSSVGSVSAGAPVTWRFRLEGPPGSMGQTPCGPAHSRLPERDLGGQAPHRRAQPPGALPWHPGGGGLALEPVIRVIRPGAPSSRARPSGPWRSSWPGACREPSGGRFRRRPSPSTRCFPPDSPWALWPSWRRCWPGSGDQPSRPGGPWRCWRPHPICSGPAPCSPAGPRPGARPVRAAGSPPFLPPRFRVRSAGCQRPCRARSPSPRPGDPGWCARSGDLPWPASSDAGWPPDCRSGSRLPWCWSGCWACRASGWIGWTAWPGGTGPGSPPGWQSWPCSGCCRGRWMRRPRREVAPRVPARPGPAGAAPGPLPRGPRRLTLASPGHGRPGPGRPAAPAAGGRPQRGVRQRLCPAGTGIGATPRLAGTALARGPVRPPQPATCAVPASAGGGRWGYWCGGPPPAAGPAPGPSPGAAAARQARCVPPVAGLGGGAHPGRHPGFNAPPLGPLGAGPGRSPLSQCLAGRPLGRGHPVRPGSWARVPTTTAWAACCWNNCPAWPPTRVRSAGAPWPWCWHSPGARPAQPLPSMDEGFRASPA